MDFKHHTELLRWLKSGHAVHRPYYEDGDFAILTDEGLITIDRQGRKLDRVTARTETPVTDYWEWRKGVRRASDE